MWGAPGPLDPPGCTCGPGQLVWKALHACRTGKSVPVPEPGPPHTQPGPGGAHKAPLFLPWNEWIGGSRDRLSAGDTRDPRGSGRGKGDRWRDGGTDGQSRCRDRRLWRDPLLRQPGGRGTGSTGWGSAHAAHAVPALGMCRDVPVSPGDASTAPWTQWPVLAPRWCRQALGAV